MTRGQGRIASLGAPLTAAAPRIRRDRNTYQAHAWDPTNLETLPTTLVGNLLVSNYRSIFAVDNDDGSNAYVITRNVLLWSGAKNLMGYNKAFLSNLYAYADYTPFASPVVRELGRAYGLHAGLGNAALREKYGGLDAVPYCTGSVAPWASADLGLADQFRDNVCIASSSANFFRWYNPCNSARPTDGSMWLMSDNIWRSSDASYRNVCGNETWSLPQAQALGVDTGSVLALLPSTPELLAMAAARIGL